ncbi:ankyrin [Coprinellus micaceus]|uniref:Ankyrin n=1 Tax=Coprinellus micaceus TaxID=71717 RepID=A0A4Y7T8P8_COPMI|nr:ankyrin [Coprinellus micaceus]
MVVKAVSTPQPLPLKTKSEPGGYTPFHVAAMYGRFENFQLLPSSYSGADVLSEGGRTVLHVAVEYHQISFIERLRDLAYQPRGQQLEPGAFGFDPCALDSEGVTPLMLASHDGKEEVVRMLLSCEGVDGNFRNGRGETVLHYATRYQDPVGNLTFNIGRHGDIEEQDRMAKFLCSIPHIDVNARDNEGNSPFMLACQSGLEGTVEYILDNFDARPPFSHQINNQGQTAMMLEFYPEGGTVKLLTELLSLDRTLINQRDHCGRTALIIAVQERGDDGAASWVLAQKSHDAEFVNARDNGGMSAFLHACHMGAPAMVEALLGLPCVDMYQSCDRARSALDWLFQKTYAEKEGVRVFQVLKRFGEWGEQDIQNMFLRALASPSIRAKEFTDLWNLTSDAFTWDLECTSTVLLLASASLKYCRIYPALVLVSLRLLPRLSFDFGRDGMGVCVDHSQQPYSWHSQTHENFRSALGVLFPGQENDNNGWEQLYACSSGVVCKAEGVVWGIHTIFVH